MMQRLFGAIGRALDALGRTVRGQYVTWVGGPARARVIALFGAVLGLASADAATVGSVAPQLEHALHIGNTKIGLLSTVALLTGALFVIPVGFLVDRVKRMPLLSASVVLWSVSSLISAFAPNYSTLLFSRLALGAVTATAGPAIASLTGDYFPARERGRVYSYILGGEILGAAVGFIVTGSIASAIGWRAAFVLLAIPGFFLARALWKTVPEPHRGGMSRLEPGAESLEDVAAASADAEWGWEEPGEAERGIQEGELAREQAQARGIKPDPRLVLDEDPRRMGMVSSIKYILSIPTNLLMIASSALGYFFFSGLQTFAILFVRGHYHVSQLTAELALGLLVVGAIIGTLISGRVTDAMLRRGVLTARVWVPAACYVGATAFLIPGILGTNLMPALWFDVAGAALIQAANPPLDAARLDIMPAGLWGRAESTRTFLRSISQALAPLLFGGLSQVIKGIVPSQTPVGTHPAKGALSPAAATGLEITFLIMLATLAAAGVFLWMSRRTYPRDVATAAASHQGTEPPVGARRSRSR
jgi:MFS family permease